MYIRVLRITISSHTQSQLIAAENNIHEFVHDVIAQEVENIEMEVEE